jgi:hypothetical protein
VSEETAETQTGEWHYREAERLIDKAHDLKDDGSHNRADFVLARAQVHALLAIAAPKPDGAEEKKPFPHFVGGPT